MKSGESRLGVRAVIEEADTVATVVSKVQALETTTLSTTLVRSTEATGFKPSTLSREKFCGPLTAFLRGSRVWIVALHDGMMSVVGLAEEDGEGDGVVSCGDQLKPLQSGIQFFLVFETSDISFS